jgi:hypothetical protein
MSAIDDIAAERKRQIEVEGWMPAHDDGHHRGQMAEAAACYALGTTRVRNVSFGSRERSIGLWPWALKWWKPSERRRDLVKAGALIVAEIERLDRAAAETEAENA